jgi:1-deoxy-D-xylulose-5-phosphate reductoisomerase
MRKIISILGSTGSIGQTALKIVDKKKNYFKIYLLSANKNLRLISQQIEKYKPNIFVVHNPEIFQKVKRKYKSKKIIILNNFKKFHTKKKIDITVSSIPGIIGLYPTILMTKYSRKILIANKESIICGWSLINSTAKKNNTKVIPIDSEHFSILKLLESHSLNEIDKIFITASGGPFLNYNFKRLAKIKPKNALQHPKWKMGKKITIDSSTLMNKIFELIEAQKLFNLPKEKIDILIHPNSLIHAIVQFKNGLSKFLYHDTNMIVPIANAILEKNFSIDEFYKNRKKFDKEKKLNLIFEQVNSKTFPIIKLKNKINEYPSTGIIINAVNEVMVEMFLKRKVPFLAINKFIFAIFKDSNYKKYAIKVPNSLSRIMLIDEWAKKTTLKQLNKL